jgi:recombination protein RecT
MACKTVINRACKLLISSSDDSILYDPLEESDAIDVTSANVEHEIKTKANKENLDFDDAEIVEEEIADIKVNATEVLQEEVQETMGF